MLHHRLDSQREDSCECCPSSKIDLNSGRNRIDLSLIEINWIPSCLGHMSGEVSGGLQFDVQCSTHALSILLNLARLT